METFRYDAQSPEAVEEAAKQLLKGELVIFPTDTVYGLGADAFNSKAIQKLFETKRRPFDKGIPILLADAREINRIVKHVPAMAQRLIGRYWPGPLTLIMEKRTDLPIELTPDDGIAVRIPDNNVARALIRAAGGAVATTSANISGSPPFLDANEAMKGFSGRVGAVLDAGPVKIGQSSTVVDCRGNSPYILREGPIREPDILTWLKH